GPKSPHSPSPLRPAGDRRRAPGYGACEGLVRARRSASALHELQVPTLGMLALEGLEQGLEVAFAEAACAMALDQLEEDRRAIAERGGEDLQEVALVVAIDEDPEATQVRERLRDRPDPPGHLLVIAVRRT